MAVKTTHKTYRVVPVPNVNRAQLVQGWRAALETAFELKQANHCDVDVYDAESGIRLRTVLA
jgi:hypothetical protein